MFFASLASTSRLCAAAPRFTRSVVNRAASWPVPSPILKGILYRRYILWCMEKYRSGLPIESFAHEPRPKKTVRGWGPSVQNGKRIRSRRDKSKKK
ncbi:hypothetical protein J132_01430 [Termitomyces sp. J132]|nr:hypothetical protein J132_01430 [Termitomyces sp. J132]